MTFMQGLSVTQQYNVMSTLRGPDCPKIKGMMVLKSSFTSRLRALAFDLFQPAFQWGTTNPLPGEITRHPMNLAVFTEVKKVVSELKGVGARHFLSHINDVLHITKVREHLIWGGYGEELSSLVSKRAYSNAINAADVDPLIEESRAAKVKAQNELYAAQQECYAAQQECYKAIRVIKAVRDAQQAAFALVK